MRLLPCGHTCPGQCGQSPCPPCRVLVKAQLPCGHAKQMLCASAADPPRSACRKMVQTVMPRCSHELTVLCGMLPEVCLHAVCSSVAS